MAQSGVIVFTSQIRRMAKNRLVRAVGEEVRRARAMLDLSHEELADRAGLYRNYIGLVERVESTPTLAATDGIAKGLRVALSELIARAEGRLK